jgi:hypothetical protein
MTLSFRPAVRWLVPLALSLSLTSVALAAGTAKKATGTLKLHVKPPDTKVTVDDKALGEAGDEKVLTLASGRHTIKLVRKGVSHEESVTVKAGETKSWGFEFAADNAKDEVHLEDSPPPAADPGQ